MSSSTKTLDNFIPVFSAPKDHCKLHFRVTVRIKQRLLETQTLKMFWLTPAFSPSHCPIGHLVTLNESEQYSNMVDVLSVALSL